MSKKIMSISSFLSIAFTSLLSSIVCADGITVILPKGNNYDVNIDRTQIEGNPDTVLNTISFVNEYLWFLIGFLCFIFLVYNGIKLVIARGDKEDMKKAIK
ncbi:hypothetical protein FACS1894176_05380 [Bacteroidia bacterium]|nr:hypothetical protein FACS189428_2460 [Clostridia bacterium]GHV25850.1 hypothetical protein FACS1894176_05380 [Bacteroidia bacterium]